MVSCDVNMIYCHSPDTFTPIEETVRAMNYVIDKGLAFYWGTSEWSAQQITEAWGIAERLDLVGPIVEQPEYNMLSRHKVRNFSVYPDVKSLVFIFEVKNENIIYMVSSC